LRFSQRMGRLLPSVPYQRGFLGLVWGSDSNSAIFGRLSGERDQGSKSSGEFSSHKSRTYDACRFVGMGGVQKRYPEKWAFFVRKTILLADF